MMWVKFDKDDESTWPEAEQQVYWAATPGYFGLFANFKVTERKTLLKRRLLRLPYFVTGIQRYGWADKGYWRPVTKKDIAILEKE